MPRKKVLYEDDQVCITGEFEFPDDIPAYEVRGKVRAAHLYTDELEIALKFAMVLTDNASGMIKLQAMTTKGKK